MLFRSSIRTTSASTPRRHTSPQLRRLLRVKADPTLSPTARLILRDIVDHLGNSDSCWPSLARLAAHAGIGTRRVRQILRELEAGGWIATRARLRPDGGRSSSEYRWTQTETPPGNPVPTPPGNPVPGKKHSDQTDSETHNAGRECCLSSEAEAPAAAAAPAEALQITSTAPERHQTPPTTDDTPTEPRPLNVTQALARLRSHAAPAAPTTTAPAAQAKGTTAARRPTARRFIVIDPARFTDPAEAHRVYTAATDGGLITGSEADRLSFFAAWCSVSRRVRARTVKRPECMMQFLLRHPKALRDYPAAEDETKAREAIRRIFH